MTLRAGVIGMGRMGKAHAAAYQDVGVKVQRVCDTDWKTLNAAADSLGVARRTDKWPGITALAQDVEIVSVCTYDDAHMEPAVSALYAGKHVLVEKPAVQTMAELQSLHRAYTQAQAQGQRLSCNLPLRGEPLFRALKRDLNTSAANYCEADYLHNIEDRLGPDSWRGQMARYSAVQGGGIHMIDLMMWLLNERPSMVFAIQANWTAICQLRFQNSIGKVTVCLDYKCEPVHRLSLPAFQIARWLGQDKGWCIRDFVQAIEQDREPDVRAKDVFDVMSVVLACDQSIASGHTEPVEYLT